MAGTIVADDIQHSTAGSVGTEYVVSGSVKCWVNFDMTPSTAVKDSFNMASFTDVSTGKVKPNYTSSMANAFYNIHVTSQENYVGFMTSGTIQTGTVETNVRYVNWSPSDTDHHLVSITGDLA